MADDPLGNMYREIERERHHPPRPYDDMARLTERVAKLERLVAEPIRDPDCPDATARLLQIREWCDKYDPWGATAAGFVVRLLRVEIDFRIYDRHSPAQAASPQRIAWPDERSAGELG